ncbi:MAG: glycosyltransferase [Pseudobutyrivibrio ruminis]|uniref:Glycosyltransferase n=1 Tax=Pseudobutyrivibrio ruminis TaxID=46206 RepID=A0A927YKY0_9FIRM|nr:glycosyltransferase [Pseudobutyrivibrio ruminis]
MDSETIKPKVSVIMPVYNGEKVCERAIKSVLNQSYKNIELIVINDGSTDRTAEIVKSISDEDDRLLLINQTNGGVSNARNAGLKAAGGEFIAFIDADDYMNSLFIETLISLILKENTDLAMCGYKNVYADGSQSVRHIASGEDMKDTLEKNLKINWINILWNKIYRKEYITQLFNTKKSMGEDLEFNIKYFLNIGSISVIDEPLYEYTHDSVGSLTKNDRLVWDAIVSDWISVKELTKKNINDALINDRMMDQLLFAISGQKDKDSVKEMLKSIRCNTELNRLLNESKFSKFKYKAFRCLINWQASNLLFRTFEIKRNVGR